MLGAIKEFWLAQADGIVLGLVWGGFVVQLVVFVLNQFLAKRIRHLLAEVHASAAQAQAHRETALAAGDRALLFIQYAEACAAAWRKGEPLPEPPPEVAIELPWRGRLN